MSTPEQYPHNQPQYPPQQPQYGPPPQYAPPQQPQYGPPPQQPQYGPPPQQYGSPPPQYPPPGPQYGAPTPPYDSPPPQSGPPSPPYGSPTPPYGSPPYGAPPAPYGAPTPPPKRSGWKVLGSFVVLIALAVAAIIAKAALGSLMTDEPTVPKPANAFESTPAATFPQGEAGIVLPAATPVAGFTAEQVAAALDQVKKAMIAARLDTTMLEKHDTSVLIGLLAQEGRPDIEDLFTKKDFMHFATQLAPNHTLAAEAIRVKGTMTFGPRTDEDIRFIEIKTNYIWVYPFSGELQKPGDHLVTIHDQITWLFPAEADVPAEFRGMYIDETQSLTSNIDCDLADQSLLALGKPRFVPGAANTDEDDAFDPNGSLQAPETC